MEALRFVTETDFLVNMGKIQAEFQLLLRKDSTLLYKDMLRLAPVHLRELGDPITNVEDIVCLFDAAERNSFLPHGVLAY